MQNVGNKAEVSVGHGRDLTNPQGEIGLEQFEIAIRRRVSFTGKARAVVGLAVLVFGLGNNEQEWCT